MTAIASPSSARTELCFGERLRRARRRSDARRRLLSAQDCFERLGAAPWEQRAVQELAATGITTRRTVARTGAELLTPQERRVAEIIVGGTTVREAADRLFLSPKTVEAHLGRVYRKLNIHNRAQLAMTLDVGQSPGEM